MKILEINQKDLKNNISILKEKLDINKTKIIAVVKANGMGLDLIQYSKFLINNGIDILAVANVSEALILRDAGITQEIIMLSEVYSESELRVLIENNIILTVGNIDEKNKINTIAKSLNRVVNIHIKIDTGFARYGFLYTQEEKILEAINNTDNVKITGVYTHFSKSINCKWTKIQFERFNKLLSNIKKINNNIIFHCSNSTAFLKYPEMNLDAVRLRLLYSRKGSC